MPKETPSDADLKMMWGKSSAPKQRPVQPRNEGMPMSVVSYYGDYLAHGDPERGGGVATKKRKKQMDFNGHAERFLRARYKFAKREEKTVWVNGMPYKKDFLGFIDWVAGDDIAGPFVGVQVTSLSCKSGHIRKIAKLRTPAKWLGQGNTILLLCFHQPKGHGTPYVPLEFWLTQKELDESNNRAEKLAKSKAERAEKKKGSIGF